MPGNSAIDPSRSATSPIPRRASALRPNEIAVRSRYPRRTATPPPASNDDITRIPTQPSPPSQPGQFYQHSTLQGDHLPARQPCSAENRDEITSIPTLPHQPHPKSSLQTSSTQLPVVWQYESSVYEVESSLSSLSLITPPWTSRSDSASPPPGPQQTPSQLSQALSSGLNFADFTTTPPPLSLPFAASPATGLQQPPQNANTPTISHNSPLWASLREEFAGHRNNTSPQRLKRTMLFYPWDQLRWWLLTPGRIEFLLWLAGALLLLSITVLFLFVTMLSLFAARLIH